MLNVINVKELVPLGSRFVPTSLFPNLSINDINEIEFRVGYHFKCRPIFDDVDFHQLLWQYERLVKEIENKDGESGDFNLLDNLEQLKNMQG